MRQIKYPKKREALLRYHHRRELDRRRPTELCESTKHTPMWTIQEQTQGRIHEIHERLSTEF